jgi:hypothetical protein
MRQVSGSRFIIVCMMLFSTACSGETQTPAVSPATQPPEVTATAATVATPTGAPTEAAIPSLTDTASPANGPSATPDVTLFTETGGEYQINLTPADFVDMVNNPYYPLPPGAKWVFEIREANGKKQTDTLEVLKEKRNVNGVQATVVRDMVSSGNKIVEDTYDWFVQDKYGNVWYVGEEVDNYVAGVLANHSGSWEWGKDGALPGIIMWADPSVHVNEEYRQEYYRGKAEDMGQVLGVGESLTVPFGSFDQVVKTLDFSKIESGKEQKFYAPGIGLLKEMDLSGADEAVLTKFTQPAP